MLASVLDVAPSDIPLTRAPGGRPVLVPNPRDVRFTISHTAGLLLVAVTAGRDLGIDVERADRRVGDGVLRRALHDRERALVAALPEDRRNEAALRLWTAKEAYVKAIGKGLAHALDEVPVEDPLGVPSLALPGWTLRRFDPAPGYVGAIVVEGGRFTLCLRGGGV